MRQILLAVLVLAGTDAGFAQGGRPYSSVGGYGNILYPGVGHAPNVNPNPVPFGFGGRGGNGSGFSGRPAQIAHPSHGRSGFVPYPVFIGGYYGGGYYGGGYADPSQQQQYSEDAPPPIMNSNGVPSVVINQTFIPDHAMPQVRDYNGDDSVEQPAPEQSGMRLHEGLKTPPYTAPARRQEPEDQPTLYLIAFKDHTIVQALGYWIEAGSLHYVSAEHTLNQASLDLIDRPLSQRLNDERSVEFKLPKSE